MRICCKCDGKMDSGYVVHGETYCSDECLYKDYTEDEYNALYEDEDSDTAYWTEWDDEVDA